MSNPYWIEVDLSGPVDIMQLAGAINRFVPMLTQQILEKEIDERALDVLDDLFERFSAEAHAARLGLTISGQTAGDPEDESDG
jgi:hypothetical protein